MRWTKQSGKNIWINDKKYVIDWDKPSRSKQQFKVKQFLRKYCLKHLMYEEYPVPGTLLKCDFLNSSQRWILEHQGIGHDYNKWVHQGSRLRYLRSIKNDMKKREILELNGYKVIETFPDDLDNLSYDFFVEKFGIYL